MPIYALSEALIDEISKGYQQLSVLCLSNNRISRIENLAKLTRLERLDLSRNDVTDVANLCCLPRLKELRLARNRIRTLDPAQLQLPRLEMLDLSENLIADPMQVNHLATMPVLAHLALMGNPVASLPLYQSGVLQCLPLLETLDGKPAPSQTAGRRVHHGYTSSPDQHMQQRLPRPGRNITKSLESSAECSDPPSPKKLGSSGAPSQVPADGNRVSDSWGCSQDKNAAGGAREEARRCDGDDVLVAFSSVRGSQDMAELASEIDAEHHQLTQLQWRVAQLEGELTAAATAGAEAEERARAAERATGMAQAQLMAALQSAEELQRELVTHREALADRVAQVEALQQDALLTAATSQDKQEQLVAALDTAQSQVASAETRLANAVHIRDLLERERDRSTELEAQLRGAEHAHLLSQQQLAQAKQELQQSSAAAAVELASERARVRDLKAQVMAEEGRVRAAELAAQDADGCQLSIQLSAAVLDTKRAQHSRSKATDKEQCSAVEAAGQDTREPSQEEAEGKPQMQLLQVRLEAMQTILQIQESEMAKAEVSLCSQIAPEGPRSELGAGGEGLLRRWRSEVFELLLCKEQVELERERERHEARQRCAALEQRVAAMQAENKVLEQKEIDRAAELQMERAARKEAAAETHKHASREHALVQAVERERAHAAGMAAAVATEHAAVQQRMNSLCTAFEALDKFTQRLRFAEARVRVVAQLRGQADVATDSPPPNADDVRAQALALPILQDSLSPTSLVGLGDLGGAGCSEELRQEVQRLQKERDMLVKQILNQNSPLVWEKRQAVKRAAKAEGHVERLKQELDVARIRLEDSQVKLEACETRCGQLQVELDRCMAESKASAEAARAKLVGEMSRRLEEEMSKRDEEVAALTHSRDLAQREADRLQVAMRGLERQLCRLKDRSMREEQAQIEALSEQLKDREEQLRVLRKERNTLLGALRRQTTDTSLPLLDRTNSSMISNRCKRAAGSKIADDWSANQHEAKHDECRRNEPLKHDLDSAREREEAVVSTMCEGVHHIRTPSALRKTCSAGCYQDVHVPKSLSNVTIMEFNGYSSDSSSSDEDRPERIDPAAVKRARQQVHRLSMTDKENHGERPIVTAMNRHLGTQNRPLQNRGNLVPGTHPPLGQANRIGHKMSTVERLKSLKMRTEMLLEED